MSGYVKAMGVPWFFTLVPIRVRADGKYTIWHDPTEYAWSVGTDQLLEWTGRVLDTFYAIETAISTQVRALREAGDAGHLVNALTLTEAVCQERLQELARTGLLAYNSVFSADSARGMLANLLTGMKASGSIPNPTFVAQTLPFTWEVLYEGEKWRDGTPEKFWGFNYAVARSQIDPSQLFTLEQDPTSNMLFCLHESLRQAHTREWPNIQGMVKIADADRTYLLGANCPAGAVADGEEFLDYLSSAEHNMLHFACHCVQRDAGKDVLLVSLMQDADLAAEPVMNAAIKEIMLDTDAFRLTLAQGKFQRSRPLVFLNACQSSGGGDKLRAYYNLPGQFIERGAAAVIATACPVPDIFAAEFARVFYGYFLRGYEMLADEPEKTPVGRLPIGEALRRTRVYFLKKHNNPMGLAYGLYTPAHYHVRESLLPGGTSP